jgi:DNA-binding beta-propeller fold protein YncE
MCFPCPARRPFAVRALRTEGALCAIPVAVFLILFMRCAPVAAQSLQPTIIDREYLTGVSLPGTLHPSSIALDQWRGLAYVQAPGAGHIAVVDMNAQVERGVIPIGKVAGPTRLRCVEPRTRTVVMSTVLPAPNGPRMHLVSIGILPNRVTAVRDMGDSAHLAVIPHPTEPLLIVSTGSRTIVLLDPATLVTVDSIPAGMRTGDIVADSVDLTLAAAECESRADSVHMMLYSLRNRESLRIFTYESAEALPGLMVDPALKHFVLFGNGIIRFFDDAGLPIHQFRVSGSIARHGFLPLTHQLIFLDSAGEAEQGRHGRFGKLFRYSLQGIDVDSFRVGYDACDLAVHHRTAQIGVLASGSATLEVSHVPSMLRRADIRLGHGADDIATTSDGQYLFIANSSGSGNRISRVELARNRAETDIATGGGPVRLLRGPDGSITVYNHYESTLAHLDPETGRPDRTIPIEGMAEGRVDVFPSLAIGPSDVLLTSFPERRSYSLNDFTTGRRIRTAAIDGYVYSAAEPRNGAVQAAWIPGSDRFALLLREQHRLNIYSLSSDTMLISLNLEGLDWTRMNGLPATLLRPGMQSGELFVGPYRVDVEHGEILPVLPGAAILLEPVGTVSVLALERRGASWFLHRIATPNWVVIRSVSLAIDTGFSASAAWSDAANGLLCLADESVGKVIVFLTQSMTEVRNIEQLQTVFLSMFPHPVSFDENDGFSIQSGQSMSGVKVGIHDLAGNLLWESTTMDIRPGANHVQTGSFAPNTGVYMLIINQTGLKRMLKFIATR